MDRLVEDDSLGDNVDSFLSHDDAAGPSDARSRCMASSKGAILWSSCLIPKAYGNYWHWFPGLPV